MAFESGTIPQTLEHLKKEGFYISENALRTWVRNGSIPASYCGRRAYLWYPNVIAFLKNGRVVTESQPKEINSIRKIG